ncbi:hypothetical protein AMOR_05500 [Anaeromyxobacter oryzae]|uniref:Uncharacterized protein n=2 Tax=Anaeromyxobacter oryzae TaxID=2918170 RepID=A0ABM7WQ03_9BACT|nr:hypothetical protein AMOR_05500 [Anaeromyxobacter oryzae]
MARCDERFESRAEMRPDTDLRPIWLRTTHQYWKAVLASILYPAPVVTFAASFLDPEPERAASWMIATGAVWLLGGLVGASVKCRVCDEWVFFWAWRPPQTPAVLFRIERCPNCGARSNDERLW